MGMDEVHERMLAFEAELEQFQVTLKESIVDTRRHGEAVSALWQDEMRREFDGAWVPLEEAMDDYVRRVGPDQVETMLIKLRHLRSYLHGD
jgi:hypothetical protein